METIEEILKEGVEEGEKQLLDVLDTVNLASYGKFIPTLKYFLTFSFYLGGVQAETAIRMTMNAFREYYPNERSLPLHSLVFTLDAMPSGFFDFYVECLPEVDYRGYIVGLFAYTTENLITIPLTRIDSVFQIEDDRVFSMILEEVNNFSGEVIDLPYFRQYFIDKLNKFSPYAPASDALLDIEDELLTTEELAELVTPMPVGMNPYTLGSIISNAAAVMDGLEVDSTPCASDIISMGLILINEVQSDETFDMKVLIDETITKLEEIGVENYPNGKQVMKAALELESYSVQKPTEDDTELFRTFGPVNPLSSYFRLNDEKSIDPCIKYGGCRMLTCWHFIDIDEDEEVLTYRTEWFTGNCENCSLKIEKKHHAIRACLKDGGWTGCYCRWECAKEHDGVDPVVRTMLETFQEQYERIGVFDRQDSNIEPVYKLDDETFEAVMSSLRGLLD